MKVSIVIPNYNGEKYLKICLNSIYRQSFSDYEIIFVDNASKDESCKLVRENYPGVKIITMDKNYGFSKAVNVGIQEAKGEFVVLLNNDTEAEEDWLRALVLSIEGNEKIFSCCSKMLQYSSRNKIDDAGDQYNLLGWAYKRGDNLDISKYSREEEVFSSCAGAAIYRKNIFNKIGYFDEDFFAYMEDVDISYRARIYGYKNLYASGARIYHIGSATSGSKYNSFKVHLAARNNLYVAYKNMPKLQIIINSPFLILGFIVKYIFFASRGFEKEYREGFIEGLKNLRGIKTVPFEIKNFSNYFKIEFSLIGNTFRYFSRKFINS